MFIVIPVFHMYFLQHQVFRREPSLKKSIKKCNILGLFQIIETQEKVIF